MNDTKNKHSLFYDIALVLIILAGFWFRSVGLDWDDGQHLHPDERFLTMVETAIIPVESADELIGAPPTGCESWGGYFDTACSSLNPHNRGHGFFVYGTLPIFAARYVAEWVGETGYSQVNLIGRQLSALADLLSIVVLYFIVARLYGRKVALLSAAFSTFAVLQIQQSHFFTVDTFTNFFMFLAIYFAVEIAFRSNLKKEGTSPLSLRERAEGEGHYKTSNTDYITQLIRNPLFLYSIGFGLALGMAVASKINAAVLAILLPAAFAFRFMQPVDEVEESAKHRQLDWTQITVFLIVGGFASLLAFRLFQPYAFSGPGFFGVIPNETWIGNIMEQRAQASGDADLPFAFQWARRSKLYSFENLTKWGLGYPLGILAWAGFLWMGWRILKGERYHLLLWGWTAFYFLWQSTQFNPTMRYQLPIYPLLAMMAAWGVFKLASFNKLRTVSLKVGKFKSKTFQFSNIPTLLAVLIGSSVLIATALWAYAFVQIYQNPHPRVAATRWIFRNVPGPINLRIKQGDGEFYQQPLTYPMGTPLQADMPYGNHFVPKVDGLLTEVTLAHVQDLVDSDPKTLSMLISAQPNLPPEQALANASLTADFSTDELQTLVLDSPIMLVAGETYFFTLSTDAGSLTVKGAAPINESSWDDGLPLRMDGYDGFGGIYQNGLNMEMYWEDNAAKLTRFTENLEKGEYLFISSNRQWATTTRVEERYPLSKAYYEYLIGCPPEKDVIWCYNVAQPGDFEEQLGYELVEVFESFPTLDIPGLIHWEVNDQFAEEAFTVYDHTKVLIFKKSPNFDVDRVRTLLGAVDLSNVVNLTPKAAGNYKPGETKDLMLSEEDWAQQRAGGTWSELFDADSPINKYPLLGLLLWYFFVFILGVFTYPIVRMAFPGLADKGYPLSRALGLVLLAYFPWLLGSFGIPYSRLTIALVLATIMLIGAWQAYRQRDALRIEWQENRKYYLMIEGLFLAFFLIDLLIRIGNPDLWHPSKGGERPMDLSYLHAVLKSTSFPPYDPWFAGGYINYYYYGFVLVGTPVKLLGLTPTTAYNFILPTLFAMVGTGAFSIGWNLLGRTSIRNTREVAEDINSESPNPNIESQISKFKTRFIAGISAAAGMILLGNLGTIRTVYHGLQRIIDSNGHYADINVFEHLWLAIRGFAKMTTGAILPLRGGDWYWLPSRVIPAPGDVEPITEFPLFTFLYSDLHAHMIVLPLAVLAIAWALSFVHARLNGKMSFFQITFELAMGGLIIGAMRPTNTWDIFAYLPLAALVVGYALFRSSHYRLRGDLQSPNLQNSAGLQIQPEQGESKSIIFRTGTALAGMAALAIFATIFYQPYIASFGQAYGETRLWTGSHTPLSSYFTHWGLFLFVIVSWMWWETHEWMANTPLSALNKLRPHRSTMNLFGAALLAFLIWLAFLGVGIGWIALPLAFWAGLLILRADLDEGKRLVLFLVGTGLVLTIAVELIVLVGDIGRMNTVFKLYLQTWTFFALSGGASLGWLLPEITKKWTPNWRSAWQSVAIVLLAGAALFTVTATFDKIRDRTASEAPPGLDGMAYMATASHWDEEDMDLGQDYQGILWMRENVDGSPVIVEANTPEYRWGSRYTIYTGLPGVVGWNWHQRQQRALIPPNLITDRVEEIRAFYETTDLSEAELFLQKYEVRYIVLGQVEQNYYPGEGLEKFESYEGGLWDEVFRDKDTVIYAVK
ncbi:MAG: glycosyltransferase family 39 protein [Anaerolineales bacterium]|uniref:Glycosyltransferase family 39 protein n=1 Tax=Candidatus Desulfolinea nitratireducens TaxID=2841698 RepID=A0A8J6TDY7_9CHLR|nr:glycosyltransferase family 39 protein [Candidatus Desulfolinea nitratireducens]